MKSIQNLLREARKKLLGSETAALDSRLLLEAASGLSQSEIIAEPGRELADEQRQTFSALIARRIAHEPVSRILGSREFYGREFKVTPAVLDPRADTECVVTLALNLLKSGQFIDVGTGSGAIAVTLCAENAALTGIASDISEAALAVAKQNAETYGIGQRLEFRHTSWLEGISQRVELIISNPPYIRDDAVLPPDVINFDPHLALFGGSDGLASYRELANQSRTCLAENAYVIVEIGHEQAQAISEIFAAHKFKCVAKAFDIAGFIRGLAFQQK